MLYTIEVLEYKSTEKPYQIITDNHGLLNVTFLLEKSNNVCQFKVSCGAMTICEPKHFGFGNFSKWVLRFDFQKSDNI